MRHKTYSDGYRVEIHYDTNAPSPRVMYDNLGKFVNTRKRDGGVLPHEIEDIPIDVGNVKKWLRDEIGAVIILTISAIDHSGVSIWVGSPTDPWDSFYAGYYIATRDAIVKEYGDDSLESLEKAKDVLLSEIETYKFYLIGDVYEMRLVNPLGEVEENVSGFYTDKPDELFDEAEDYFGNHDISRYHDGQEVCRNRNGRMYARISEDGDVTLEHTTVLHLGNIIEREIVLAADADDTMTMMPD